MEAGWKSVGELDAWVAAAQPGAKMWAAMVPFTGMVPRAEGERVRLLVQHDLIFALWVQRPPLKREGGEPMWQWLIVRRPRPLPGSWPMLRVWSGFRQVQAEAYAKPARGKGAPDGRIASPLAKVVA